MRERMIERLELLAEIGETKWLQEIMRHTKALEQASRQRRLLIAYRDKLQDGWRSGSVIDAGTAKRAADFVGASARAEQQIEQMERQASQQLELARQGFAQTQERRRGLETAKQATALATERATAQRMERAQAQKPVKKWRSV